MAVTLMPADQAGEPPAATSAPAEPPDTLTVTIVLEGIFRDWLLARARHHQQDPAEHAAAILRAYWAHHDPWRHAMAAGTVGTLRQPSP